ncbi:MAG: pirin family protein [Chitinivibrionales bacterium]|nr:pirin family protein [Chitinivibrionales bacterium]
MKIAGKCLCKFKTACWEDYMIAEMKIWRAIEMPEGDGAVVKRLFPTPAMSPIDPFILLDEFFVGPDAGFPDHTHRGFEAITYMLEGGFNHKDNLGNNSMATEGGAQRFTAGKGIVHSEMPGNFSVNHGFQLWVNLPKKSKQIAPSYQLVNAREIPVTHENGVSISTLAGDTGPIELHTPVHYRHIAMEKNAHYHLSIPESHRGFCYVYHNSAAFNGTGIDAEQAIMLFDRTIEITALDNVKLIAITGTPWNEPIKLNGPFVD